MSRQTKQFGIWKCQCCGIEKPATAHQNRKKYCSKECVSKIYKISLLGKNNPNFKNKGLKVCIQCQKEFKSYDARRKFCCKQCYVDYGNIALRNNAKKDANHNFIVAILEKGGAIVKDMSKAMNGIPDLLVWHFKQWHLIEIKNPETSYGKKGLNKTQMKWANDWKGGPVYIVRTEDDANKFLIGEFEEIEKVGGFKEEGVIK